MRTIALVVGIIGLGVLVGLLLRGPMNVETLDGLVIGGTVRIEGIVEEERKFGNGKLLIINEMPVYCECAGKYVGSKVIVEGIIEKFPEELRVRAFKVEILD